MACRVGITTDLERRRREWLEEHPNLENWELLGTYSSKTEAQKAETEYAKEYVCEAHTGGSGPEYATWYVYKFDY